MGSACAPWVFAVLFGLLAADHARLRKRLRWYATSLKTLGDAKGSMTGWEATAVPYGGGDLRVTLTTSSREELDRWIDLLKEEVR